MLWVDLTPLDHALVRERFAHPHRGNTLFWGHFGTERWVPFLHLHLGTIFYRSPKRNCRGVSMGVDLGIAFCPGAMGLDTSGHRAPGRRIGLGSSPWFPGVSLPSCAKPNKLLNSHECWVLFLKGHECEVGSSPAWFMAGMEQALAYGSQLSTPRGGRRHPRHWSGTPVLALKL